MIVITELLLYLSFSVLIGSLLVLVVPIKYRPEINISKPVLLICTALIPILSFGPLLRVSLILSNNVGMWVSFRNVLFTFEIGRAWLFTLILAVLLFLLLATIKLDTKEPLIKVALVFIVLLAFGVGKAGHAASITPWTGFIAHSVHFLAVIIWIGILLVIGFGSKDFKNWPLFLKWFTPLSIVCVSVTFIAGYLLMEIDIQSYNDQNAFILTEYANGLVVNYGQALLLKHLFFIPILLFAFLNGVVLKKRLAKHSNVNIARYLRIEGIYALIVFGITAFMGQQYPPHQVDKLVQSDGVSPLFELFYQDAIDPTIQVSWALTGDSLIFFTFAFLFLILNIFMSIKRFPTYLVILVGTVVPICMYLGIMLGVR
ncbi:CopD family protein (plasmid) [Alkalihalobacillus hwajinpoensis]|uniref:copper resistance D family protein n=1 Tax=Guptibacillus hwajinpoensis TaxID=208199 RepID=UPI00188455C4|nr:CopD family protein [Pseudalkalibacillus hwajinpoensis]MBF0706795.1 CopD family protein [Pseudalkalibacillus hwajinpoensis]